MQRCQRHESAIKLVQLIQIDVVEVAKLIPISELGVSALVTDGLGRPHELDRAVIEEQRLVVIAAGLGFFELVLNAAKVLRALWVQHEGLIDHGRVSPREHLAVLDELSQAGALV